MFLSVFDLFKIGIGPSSSHTMGPMTASNMFIALLHKWGDRPARLRCSLHGSLAFTGKGHGTDRAVCLGLTGCAPDSLDPDAAEGLEAALREAKILRHDGLPDMAFDPAADLIFDYETALPGHANAMKLWALDAGGAVIRERVYYSIGGGFVVEEGDLEEPQEGGLAEMRKELGVPFPFGSADEMLAMGDASGLSLVEMKRANEEVLRPRTELDAGMDAIWDAMRGCMERGLRMEGTLPGGLMVRRRARAIREALLREHGANAVDPYAINEWLSLYAMAVNEENAGRGGGDPGGAALVFRPSSGRDAGGGARFPAGRLRNRRAYQAQRLDLRRGGRLSGRGRLGERDGGGGADGGARRLEPADRERRRNRAGASSRHDLRSGGRAGAGALYRAQWLWRGEGGDGLLAGAARGRAAFRQPRQMRRDHAPDRPRSERQV